MSDYSSTQVYEDAIKHSYYNLSEVKSSKLAGCFHCKTTFTTDLVTEDKHCIQVTPHGTQDPTVFCPFCGIDTVIGDLSGFPVESQDFLEYLHNKNTSNTSI